MIRVNIDFEAVPAVVQQRGQVDAVVPVRCEVLDVAVGQHSLAQQIFLG